MKYVLVAAICTFVSACASSGVQVSEDQARSFQVGKTTYSDVVAALGPPTSSIMTADGTRTAIYTYSSIASRPQNFIPYIGPLVAGYDSKVSNVTFAFDGREVLRSTTSAQTNLGTGANLAAAGAGQSQTNQPR